MTFVPTGADGAEIDIAVGALLRAVSRAVRHRRPEEWLVNSDAGCYMLRVGFSASLFEPRYVPKPRE
jgi:hypothetical protein